MSAAASTGVVHQGGLLKPLLVGELNPYGADPHFALYPEPRGASGDRLCRLIMGLSGGRYMAAFDRVNLCTGKWSKPEAMKRAQELCDDGEHEIFVLLGRKVTEAFLLGRPEPFTVHVHCAGTFVVLPHPSGLCREWGKPGAVERARAALRQGGVLPVAEEPVLVHADGDRCRICKQRRSECCC